MSRLQGIEFNADYFPAAFVSFIFFLVLFKFVNPRVSRKLFSKFEALPTGKQLDFSCRVNSSVHAVIATSLCVYAFVTEEDLISDPIWYDSPVVRTACAVVAGYMVSDVVVMAIHYKDLGEVFFFFHHAASIYAYYFVMVYGVVPYFANYRLLAEFSTPFVNNRYFFDILGYKKTHPMAFTNGILMTLSFFIVRIFVIPHYWYKVYLVYGTEDFIRTGHIQAVLIVTCAVLDIINVFWSYRMLKGVHKVIYINFIDKNRNEITVKTD